MSGARYSFFIFILVNALLLPTARKDYPARTSQFGRKFPKKKQNIQITPLKRGLAAFKLAFQEFISDICSLFGVTAKRNKYI